MVKTPAEDKTAVSGGKGFRNRFWNSAQRHTVAQGDPISKQFDSNRGPGPDAWIKPTDEEVLETH